ncbi:MAG TPA: hypothetical protein VGG11_17255 [Xanthobacteraceae bacterium]|jgi:hypothetical protein
MKGCLGVFGVLVGLVVLAVGYVLLGFYNIHVRYRLTVEVQDGDQIKTGSSVIDASYTIEPDYISWSGPDTYVRIEGYAPTVDLGEKGLLFLTFADSRTGLAPAERRKLVFCLFTDIGCLPFVAYDKPGTTVVNRPFSERKAELTELLRQGGPRDVPFVLLPKMAQFQDANDPNKLVPVPPDDLTASFGPGVRLKRVILQLTDDPVTPRPQTWPQWLTESGQTYVGILSGVTK